MIGEYSDKTFYILYRMYNFQVSELIMDKSKYYSNKNGESFLAYYVYLMNKYFNIPLESVSSQIPFSQIWCEKVLSKQKAEKLNTLHLRAKELEKEYDSAKKKLFK